MHEVPRIKGNKGHGISLNNGQYKLQALFRFWHDLCSDTGCSLRISFFYFYLQYLSSSLLCLILNCTCTSEFNLWLCVANVPPHWHKRNGWSCVFPRPQSADTVSAICRSLKGKENSLDWSSDNSRKKRKSSSWKKMSTFFLEKMCWRFWGRFGNLIKMVWFYPRRLCATFECSWTSL